MLGHTSTMQFIEKRFGVHEKNISPWRRAVAGDLTTAFKFKNPNETRPRLPSTSAFLPANVELAGGSVDPFVPMLSEVIVGTPGRENGIPPPRIAVRIGRARLGARPPSSVG